MKLWKTLILTFLLLTCAAALPEKPNRPEFCAQRSQVSGDAYSGPKDARLIERTKERSNSILLRVVKKDCRKDIEGFLAHPDEVSRLPSLCHYFRIEDYRKLRDALIAQVTIACAEKADALCHGYHVSKHEVARACVERNLDLVLEALATGKTSIGVLD